MNTCDSCGDEFEPLPLNAPDNLVSASGWCAPSEVVHSMVGNQPVLCLDCEGRLLCIAMIGVDPGRGGENLRVPRGGIQFKGGESQ